MRQGLLLGLIGLLVAVAAGCARQGPIAVADAANAPDREPGSVSEPAPTVSHDFELSTQETAELRLAAGDRHLDLGEYHLPVGEYGEAIRLDSELAEAYYKRGRAFTELRQHVRAIEDFQEALSLDPRYAVDPVYRHDRGFAFHHLRRYLSAIEDYDEAVRLDPEYAEAHKNRGLAYAGLRQYDRVIENYNVAIGLNPDYVGAYNNRGLAYGSLGEYERAVLDYNDALRIDPEFAKSYAGRALAFAFLGRGAEASRDARRAVELGIEQASLERMLEQIRESRRVVDGG